LLDGVEGRLRLLIEGLNAVRRQEHLGAGVWPGDQGHRLRPDLVAAGVHPGVTARGIEPEPRLPQRRYGQRGQPLKQIEGRGVIGQGLAGTRPAQTVQHQEVGVADVVAAVLVVDDIVVEVEEHLRGLAGLGIRPGGGRHDVVHDAAVLLGTESDRLTEH
jgi:hypothetical protein